MTDLPAYLRPFVLGVLDGPDVRVDRLGEIDFYRPAGTARTGAVLFVHGGPGPAGLEVMPREWPVYRGYATAAARRGLVAAVVDHSLIHGFDQLVTAADEVEAAVGVLRSDPRVDPDRVGLWFFSGAGLLAGEWLDSRPDWLRWVALTYPLLATPPGVDDLVNAAEVIGKHKDLPVLLTRAGLEHEELAGPVAEFVSAGGAALDIIDVPKGHHGFDMLDHTEESRAAVTKALDWAIAHLGEEPGRPGQTPRPPSTGQDRHPAYDGRRQAGRTAASSSRKAPAEPASRPGARHLRQPADVPDPDRHSHSAVTPPTPSCSCRRRRRRRWPTWRPPRWLLSPRTPRPRGWSAGSTPRTPRTTWRRSWRCTRRPPGSSSPTAPN